MIRETVAALAAEVQHARTVLGISQNEFARRCGVHPSILSRLLAGKVVSSVAEKKIRGFIARRRLRLASPQAAREVRTEALATR